ncbi:hypothetical protein V6N13_148186 [Hibiscus sabdariffa]
MCRATSCNLSNCKCVEKKGSFFLEGCLASAEEDATISMNELVHKLKASSLLLDGKDCKWVSSPAMKELRLWSISSIVKIWHDDRPPKISFGVKSFVQLKTLVVSHCDEMQDKIEEGL